MSIVAIGDNTLKPTEVGQDLAGTDAQVRVYSEQLKIIDDFKLISGKGVVTTFQAISIIGAILIYDATTGDLVQSLLRQSIMGYNFIKLDDSVTAGNIALVQYRY